MESNILKLPDEIQVNILQYCVTNLKSVRLTCKSWNLLFKNNSCLNKNLVLHIGTFNRSILFKQNDFFSAKAKSKTNYLSWYIKTKANWACLKNKSFIQLLQKKGKYVNNLTVVGEQADVTSILNSMPNLEVLNLQCGVMFDYVFLSNLKFLTLRISRINNGFFLITNNLKHLEIIEDLEDPFNNFVQKFEPNNLDYLLLNKNLQSLKLKYIHYIPFDKMCLSNMSQLIEKITLKDCQIPYKFLKNVHNHLNELVLKNCQDIEIDKVWSLPNIKFIKLLDNSFYRNTEHVINNVNIEKIEFSGALSVLKILLEKTPNLNYLGIGRVLFKNTRFQYTVLYCDFDLKYYEIIKLLVNRSICIPCSTINFSDVNKVANVFYEFVKRNKTKVVDLIIGNQAMLYNGDEFPKFFMRRLKTLLQSESAVLLYFDASDYYNREYNAPIF